MKTSRIITAVTFAILCAATVAFGSPTKAPPFGIFGWIAMGCLLTCAAVGAVVGLQEFRANRLRRREPAVREVPASNGIQVLGTFLDDDEDGAR